MEYTRLQKEVKYLATNGVTLNVEERMNVGLALGQLQCELKFEELLLWGKVEGKYKLDISFMTVSYFSSRMSN
jgi:hypothetical protein